MKKITSLLLTLCILLTVCCAGFMTITASAAEKIEGTEVTWSFDYQSKTLAFDGKGAIPDYDTYEDENGLSLIPWGGCDYNTVEFGNEITGIGNYAFRKSLNLVTVTIPSTITKIGKDAFSNCLALKSVTIKNGVTEISEGLFAGCTGMTNVELPDGITTIGKNAFYRCSAIRFISLPDSVKTIDAGAFNTCTALESFTSPKSLETIGDRAFYCCEQLKTVTLNESMSYIGVSAFDSCASLKEITLPSGIQKISEAAFSGCSGLEKVLIPEGTSAIEANAFQFCSSLKNIRIPYSIETIGEKALGYGSRGKLISDFAITGYDGTAAQKYAADNNIKFNSLGDPLEKSGMISDTITWSIDDEGNLVFVGSGEMPDYSLYDMPVYLNSEFQSVSLDKEITKVGAYSLIMDCELFYVGEKVASIGEKAIGYHFDETGKLVKNEDFVILGYKGTAAEKYAEANGFTLMPIVDEGRCGEKSTWSYDIASETLTISGEGSADIYYDDSVMPCFFMDGYTVGKVIVNEGITELADDAFVNIENGDKIITFRVAKSVKTIGSHAIGYVADYVLNGEELETEYIQNENCVIEGYDGTAAKEYANANKIDFVVIDPEIDPPVDADTTFKLSDKAVICTLDDTNKIIKIYDRDATAEKIMADFVIGKDLVVSEIKTVATGETLKTSYSAAVSNTYTLALMGDVNGDGKVNSVDALCVLRHAVSLDVIEGAGFVAADLDGNNNVNSADALVILRIAVGIDKLGDLYPKAETPTEPTTPETPSEPETK